MPNTLAKAISCFEQTSTASEEARSRLWDTIDQICHPETFHSPLQDFHQLLLHADQSFHWKSALDLFDRPQSSGWRHLPPLYLECLRATVCYTSTDGDDTSFPHLARRMEAMHHSRWGDALRCQVRSRGDTRPSLTLPCAVEQAGGTDGRLLKIHLELLDLDLPEPCPHFLHFADDQFGPSLLKSATAAWKLGGLKSAPVQSMGRWTLLDWDGSFFSGRVDQESLSAAMALGWHRLHQGGVVNPSMLVIAQVVQGDDGTLDLSGVDDGGVARKTGAVCDLMEAHDGAAAAIDRIVVASESNRRSADSIIGQRGQHDRIDVKLLEGL